MSIWAHDFYEIQDAVGQNTEVKSKILELVSEEPIHGKVVEGGNRTDSLREILVRFFEGEIGLQDAIGKVAVELPRRESAHQQNNRVFPHGWDERLIRIQVSRFYNQAVLLILKERGEQSCYIPHSPEEDSDTPCTTILAGSEANVDVLLDRLERTYGQADYHGEVKIPNHPHCTHTIVPTSEE